MQARLTFHGRKFVKLSCRHANSDGEIGHTLKSPVQPGRRLAPEFEEGPLDISHDEAMDFNLLFVTHPSRFLQSHLRAVHSIMYPFSSLLVMGSLAIQAVLSLPDPSRVQGASRRDLETLCRLFHRYGKPDCFSSGYLPS